jgi:retron-type reverse transcriptase
MSSWQSQHFLRNAPREITEDVLQAAIEVAQHTQAVDSDMPPIFSLRHLAHYTDTDYLFLRGVVERDENLKPYKVFKLKKKGIDNLGTRYRWICSPCPQLLAVQRWINKNILEHRPVHKSSFAYRKNTSAYDAAKLHCRANWLIKLDVKKFFESVFESDVYPIFLSAGYQPLVAFELTRLCTRIREIEYEKRRADMGKYLNGIHTYASPYIGHLPQGAPTSPILANLAVLKMDEELDELAFRNNFSYSRYADDITLSTDSRSSTKSEIMSLVGKAYRVLQKHRLRPNNAKLQVRGPGTRKIVLGYLVEDDTPTLTREFRNNLRMHVYYLKKFGAVKHARKREFISLLGMRNHIEGLIAHAMVADKPFALECKRQLNEFPWPIFTEPNLASLFELNSELE